MHPIASWQIHMGYGNAFHAECLVALLAIEVDMHIVVFVYVSAHAQFIANAVASVLYYMHQMVMPDLSIVRILFSSSLSDMGRLATANDLTTNIRLAVGLI